MQILTEVHVLRAINVLLAIKVTYSKTSAL